MGMEMELTGATRRRLPQGAIIVICERRALMNYKNILNESVLSIKILKPLLSHFGLVAMEKVSPGCHSNQTPVGDRKEAPNGLVWGWHQGGGTPSRVKNGGGSGWGSVPLPNPTVPP